MTGLNLITLMIDPTKPINMEELGTTENYIKQSRTTQNTKGTKGERTGMGIETVTGTKTSTSGTQTGTTMEKKEEKKSDKGDKKSKTGDIGSSGQTCDSLQNDHELAKVITDTTKFSWYIKNCFPKYALNLLLK